MPRAQDQSARERRIRRNRNRRFSTAQPFVHEASETPEQDQAHYERFKAMEKYVSGGDPTDAIRLGLIPVGTPRARNTQYMKDLREDNG